MSTTNEYEEVIADHRRLVRELDVALNGEAGAAKQATLGDLLAQVRATETRITARIAAGGARYSTKPISVGDVVTVNNNEAGMTNSSTPKGAEK